MEMGLSYVSFKTIGDSIILVCYYLELLKMSKTEVKPFIRELVFFAVFVYNKSVIKDTESVIKV